MKYLTTLNAQEYQMEIIDERSVRINDEVYEVDFQVIGDHQFYSLLVNGKSYEANVFQVDNCWQVVLKGRLYSLRVEDERDVQLRLASQSSVNPRGEFHLKAPMPGLIISLPVHAGQVVEKGEVLAILESMKMQNELKSPRAGVVSRLRIKVGDNVEQKQILLSVE